MAPIIDMTLSVWVGDRLELGGHHDVDEDDDQHAEHQEVAERILLVLEAARETDCDSRGHVHLVYLQLRLCHDLAHRHAVDNGRDRNQTLAVLSLDGRGSETLHNLAELLEADSLSGGGIDHDVLDVGYLRAVLGGIHHLYVILFTVLTILRRYGTVDAVTQIGGRRLEIQAVYGELLTVEVNLIFGLVIGA